MVQRGSHVSRFLMSLVLKHTVVSAGVPFSDNVSLVLWSEEALALRPYDAATLPYVLAVNNTALQRLTYYI